MGYLPVSLDLTGRRVVVVGGGPVAARKVAALVSAGARVVVIAPVVCPELDRLTGDERAVLLERRPYRGGDLEGASIAFAATDDPRVQEEIAEEARRHAVWLNAVDEPERCTLLMPAILERGPIQIAVSTGGASPALAARVRDDIGAALGPEYGRAGEHLGKLRRRYAAGEARRRAFARLLDAGLLEAFRQGDLSRVARMTEDACRDLLPLPAGEG